MFLQTHTEKHRGIALAYAIKLNVASLEPRDLSFTPPPIVSTNQERNYEVS